MGGRRNEGGDHVPLYGISLGFQLITKMVIQVINLVYLSKKKTTMTWGVITIVFFNNIRSLISIFIVRILKSIEQYLPTSSH